MITIAPVLARYRMDDLKKYEGRQPCLRELLRIHRAGWVPDNKDHGLNMGPTRGLSAPDGPHVGPMNIVIRVASAYDVALIGDTSHLQT